MKKLILVLLLMGCGIHKVSDQDIVTDIVWKDYYHENILPPIIDWVVQLDCPRGFLTGDFYWSLDKHQCVAGVFWTDIYFIQVGYVLDIKLSHTSLAHELLHAHILLNYDTNGDPDHKNPGFLPGGLVDQINADLAVRGL